MASVVEKLTPIERRIRWGGLDDRSVKLSDSMDAAVRDIDERGGSLRLDASLFWRMGGEYGPSLRWPTVEALEKRGVLVRDPNNRRHLMLRHPQLLVSELYTVDDPELALEIWAAGARPHYAAHLPALLRRVAGQPGPQPEAMYVQTFGGEAFGEVSWAAIESARYDEEMAEVRFRLAGRDEDGCDELTEVWVR